MTSMKRPPTTAGGGPAAGHFKFKNPESPVLRTLTGKMGHDQGLLTIALWISVRVKSRGD